MDEFEKKIIEELKLLEIGIIELGEQQRLLVMKLKEYCDSRKK